MLKAYYCRVAGDPPTVPEALLSSYRKEKLDVQTAPSARRESVFSELLLCCALCDSGFQIDGPLEISEGEHGKPFLTGREVFFNLSHSSDMLLCALSDCEVGADVQIRSEAKLPLMERFFAEDERAYVLSAQDTDDAFTEIWTEKESWIKRCGLGLALPLRSFSVLDKNIAPLLAHRGEGEYHLSVCGEAVREGAIEWIEVKEDALLG